MHEGEIETRYEVGDTVCVDHDKTTDETKDSDGYLWIVEEVHFRRMPGETEVYYRCRSMQTGEKWNWFEDELCA